MTEQGICVRCAINSDAQALSDLAAAVFPLGGRPGADPSDLAHYIARELTAECFGRVIASPDCILFVAEMPDHLCGCVLVRRSSPHAQIEGAGPAELRRLYVLPAHHGRGLADQLMRHAFATLARDCMPTVWLSVYSENPRAIAFYKRWGFRIVGTHEVLVGADPQKDFLMRRDSPLAPQKEPE